MPTLIACLSSGKGTWTEVFKVMNSREWDQIYLITNQFGKDKVQPKENTEILTVDLFGLSVQKLVKEIKNNLADKIKDFEVALNLSSGTGKEHMAILEAVLELGLNFRLITLENDETVSLGLERN